MKNKYDAFYEEIIFFAKMLNWCDLNSVIGASESEINLYEKSNKLLIGLGYRSYLMNFGKKADIKFLSIDFGFRMFKELEELEKEYDSNWQHEISLKIAEDLFKENTFEKGKPILIYDLLETGVIMFTMSDQEEFYIYDYNVDIKKIEFKIPFTTFFRRNLYSSLMQASPGEYSILLDNQDSLFFNKNIVDRIPWLNFYKELKRKNYRSFYIPRDKYYSICHEQEISENRIKSIDEFERDCIKYLIEFEGVDPMPEIFDPYNSSSITFKEYLADDSVSKG